MISHLLVWSTFLDEKQTTNTVATVWCRAFSSFNTTTLSRLHKENVFLPVGARGPKQTHSTATFLKSLKVEVKTKYEQNVDNSMNLFFLQTVDMLNLYISNSLRLSLMSLLPDN